MSTNTSVRRPRSAALVATLTAVALATVSLVAPSSARADAPANGPVTYHPVAGGDATITLDHGTYEPGDTVTITGEGFVGTDGAGGVHVVVKPDDGKFAAASYGGADAVTPGDAGGLATFSSHDDGTFTGTVKLPSDLPSDGPGTGEQSGQHWLRFLAGTFGNPMPAVSFQAWFAVAAPATAPKVTAQPEDVSVKVGEDAAFTAKAEGTPEPTVRWQSKVSGGDWKDVPGATGATLTVAKVTAGQDGTRYRAVFTNGAGTATSDAATLAVTASAPATVTATFDKATYTPGDTVTLTVKGLDDHLGQNIRLASDGGYTDINPSFNATVRKIATTEITRTVPVTAASYDGTHHLAVLSADGTTLAEATFAVTGATEPDPFYVSFGNGSAIALGDGSRLLSLGSAEHNVLRIAAGYTEPNTTFTLYRDDAPVLDGGEPVTVTTDAAGFSANAPTFGLDLGGLGLTDGQTTTFSLRSADGTHLGTDKVVHVVELSLDATLALDKDAYAVGDTVRVTGENWWASTDAVAPSAVDLGLETADGTRVALTGDATLPVAGSPEVLASATAQLGTVETAGKLDTSLALPATNLSPALADGWYRVVASSGRTPASSTVRELRSGWFKVGDPTSPEPGDGDWSPEGTKHTFKAADGTLSLWYPDTVPAGGTMTIYGEGWLTKDGTSGSTVAVKLAHDGVFVNTANPALPSNTTVWALGHADTAGRWKATFALPTAANGDQDWNVPGERVSFQLLTGSLADGDVVRSYAGAFNVAFDPATGLPPVFGSQPQSVTVNEGDPVTVTAEASGTPAPRYLWQTDDGSGWSDPLAYGSATTTLLASAKASDDGLKYRVMAQNSAGQAVSAVGTLTVTKPAGKPVVTTQPVSTTVEAGKPATFTAAASGDPEPAVRWQASTDGATWTDVPGATSPTLVVPAPTVDQDGTGYRAVFTNSAGSATSQVATLAVVNASSSTKTYTGSSDPSVTFTAPTAVVVGDSVVVTGTGWKTTSGLAGSGIAVKYDDGAISTTGEVKNPDGSVQLNKQVFAVAGADADGSWTVRVPFPTTKNSSLAKDWAVGETHSVRLLTGSIVSGDKVRSETASFTIVAKGSACDEGQVLVSDAAGGQTATACVQEQVTTGAGRTIAVTGHGWLTKDGKAGSTVVLKLASRPSPSSADFQFVHTGAAGDAVLEHPVNGKADPTIWAIVKADAHGDIDTVLPVPQASNLPGNVGSAGALKAGSKLVVHFQSGLLDEDTQHTVDSTPLVVDGTEYAGDQDASVVPCTAAGTFEAHVVAPGGQKVDATTGPVVGYGDTIELAGTGWCNSDPAKGGSIIAIKIDEGKYSHRPGELVNANPQVWKLVDVNSADGSFDVTITLPKKGDVAGGTAPTFSEGVHTFRLLTGSLKPGDPIRTFQTGPFTVGTYQPNGLPDVVEAHEDLTSSTRHGMKATIGAQAVKVTLAGAKKGDWVFLTAYTADGSVRYPWGGTWFRAGTGGVVTAPRAGSTLPAGTFKLAAQAPDSGVLGWTSLTVGSSSTPSKGSGPTGVTSTKGSSPAGHGGAGKAGSGGTASGSDGSHSKAPASTTSGGGTRGGSSSGGTIVADPGRTSAPVPVVVQSDDDAAAEPAPTSTPAPPVASDEALTTANASGVTATQDGTVVTLTLPEATEPGSWVFLYVYSSPTAVGWVQVDAARQVKVDVGLMEPGLHKIAVVGSDETLVGWAHATVPAPTEAAADDPGTLEAPASAGDGGQPTTASSGRSGLDAADAWLLMVALAVLVAAAVTVGVVRSRRSTDGKGA